MHIAKMTSDGQVTIPEELRSKLGLEEGDELMFFVESEKIMRLRVLKPRRLREFAGALPATLSRIIIAWIQMLKPKNQLLSPF
ncbi:MAG: AbrB/MazE/SpoVT family DNA-binding domain-containing protein [Hormoscilla sp.]